MDAISLVLPVNLFQIKANLGKLGEGFVCFFEVVSRGNMCLVGWCPSTPLQILLECKSVSRVNFKGRKTPSVHFKLRDNLRDGFSATFDVSATVLTIFF